MPSFPTTGVLDNFTRADENPLSDGGNWSGPIFSGDGVLEVISDQCCEVLGGGGEAAWETNFPGTVESWAFIANIDVDPFVAACLAGVGGSATGYTLNLNAGGTELDLFAHGGAGLIASYTGLTVAPGDGIGLGVIAGTIDVWWKAGSGAWTLLGTTADSTYTSGQIGIGTNAGTDGEAAFTSFGGGGVGGVSVTGPALDDGVPGLEGLHQLVAPSPWPSVTMNDWMDPSTGLTVLPHTRLQTITGLFDKPDSDDPRVNLVNQVGELPFPRQQRGKTIVYTGVAVGATLSVVRAKIAALRAASATASSNPAGWSLLVEYDPTYDPTGMEFTGYGMPIAFTSDDTQGSSDQSPSPYIRSFVLSFRLSDPRFWLTSGPLSLGSPTPIADGVTGTLTMTGTAPSEPTFTVHGSGAGSATIVIVNDTLVSDTGRGTLTIAMPIAMASGDTLVVDFFARTVTFTPISTGIPHDYSGYIDWSNTDYWGEAAASESLLVGANVLEVTGDPWSVTAIPAVW